MLHGVRLPHSTHSAIEYYMLLQNTKQYTLDGGFDSSVYDNA